jgi:hypothetical protein
MKRILVNVLLMLGSAIVTACQPASNVSTSNQASLSDSSSTPVSDQPNTSFDEAMYLFVNPDIKQLIQQGKYKSGLEHYEQVGQTAKKPNGESYESFFTGTSGNDVIQGFGKGEHAHFSGVKLEIIDKKDDPLPLRPQSLGQGEMDVLVGTTEGGNEFVLGSFITSVNPKAEPFYVGKGDTDYARIQNFTKTKDSVILAGEPSQYTFKAIDGNMQISTQSGDLIAIVEGIDKLEVGEIVKDYGVFTMK